MEEKNEIKFDGLTNWSEVQKNVFVANNLGIDKERVIMNGEQDRRIVASKYMPLSRFVNAVKFKKFSLISPLLWRDPFEMLFFKPKVQIGNEIYCIYACCFAGNDIQNEEGFWNVWSNDCKEPIIRVTYDMEKLLEVLSNKSINGLSLYLGAMEYLTRFSLLEKKGKSLNKTYSNVPDYLNDCLLKRDAYSYEIELRLFSVIMADKENDVFNIEEVDYATGIIADVTLPPLEPMGNSHPSLMMYKCMQDCINMSAKQKIENLKRDGLLKCDIKQSALYCTDIVERSY